MSIGLGDSRIRLHFDVHEPIELVELTLSFQAVAREYRSFLVNRVRQEGGRAKDTDIKLYVTKIENTVFWLNSVALQRLWARCFRPWTTSIFLWILSKILRMRSITSKKWAKLEKLTPRKFPTLNGKLSRLWIF